MRRPAASPAPSTPRIPRPVARHQPVVASSAVPWCRHSDTTTGHRQDSAVTADAHATYGAATRRPSLDIPRHCFDFSGLRRVAYPTGHAHVRVALRLVTRSPAASAPASRPQIRCRPTSSTPPGAQWTLWRRCRQNSTCRHPAQKPPPKPGCLPAPPIQPRPVPPPAPARLTPPTTAPSPSAAPALSTTGAGMPRGAAASAAVEPA